MYKQIIFQVRFNNDKCLLCDDRGGADIDK